MCFLLCFSAWGGLWNACGPPSEQFWATGFQANALCVGEPEWHASGCSCPQQTAASASVVRERQCRRRLGSQHEQMQLAGRHARGQKSTAASFFGSQAVAAGGHRQVEVAPAASPLAANCDTQTPEHQQKFDLFLRCKWRRGEFKICGGQTEQKVAATQSEIVERGRRAESARSLGPCVPQCCTYNAIDFYFSFVTSCRYR